MGLDVEIVELMTGESENVALTDSGEHTSATSTNASSRASPFPIVRFTFTITHLNKPFFRRFCGNYRRIGAKMI